MKNYQMIPMLLVLAYNFVEAVEIGGSKKTVDFQYRDVVEGRYLNLTIIQDGKLVRVLHGDPENNGAFEYEEFPLLSPDKNFVLLNQVASGRVALPNNATAAHEVAYCNLVDVRSGCIVAKETGQFCGGTFTQDGKWENPVYADFYLLDEAPKAKKYVDGELAPSSSEKTSFENLLVCDPPDGHNSEYYRAIIDKNIFKTGVQK